MDGGGSGPDGGHDQAIGSSAGAAERARRTAALEIANALAAATGDARENALDHAAYEMGRVVGHGLDRGDAASFLHAGAVRCGLVEAIGVDEVQSAIAGGIQEGERSAGEEVAEASRSAPAVIDGDDDEPISPRQWLLGTTFARGFVSAVIAPGATGKTALRMTQLMALATGRSLTRERVHARVPVLQVSLEDSKGEMRRRLRACRLHHRVDAGETRGWYYWMALAGSAAQLVTRDEAGAIVPGPLAETISQIVREHGIAVVSFDPFVKLAGVDENDNRAVDQVMQVLVRMADTLNVAIDVTHHTRKGALEAGDADAGRGASSMRDAARLAMTLITMTKDEAGTYGIAEADRRRYVRYDMAKVNLAPSDDTRWYYLASVAIGNATEAYPEGDHVQTVEPWTPTGVWDGVGSARANEILTAIDAGPSEGERYTDYGKGERAAWRVVLRFVPEKTDLQARAMVQTWVRNGVLERRQYQSATSRRGDASGLWLNHAKRPS